LQENETDVMTFVGFQVKEESQVSLVGEEKTVSIEQTNRLRRNDEL
jgi:hypothetical protein